MATVVNIPGRDFSGLAAGLQNFVQGRLASEQKRREVSDAQGLLQFIRETQAGGQVNPFTAQTRAGANAQLQFQGQQLTAAQQQQAAANLALTQAQTTDLLRPPAATVQRPVSLSPGQSLVDPTTGETITSIPQTPTPKAGSLQVARAGDESGLPAGTVFQKDPVGNVKIISEVGEIISAGDKAKLAVDQSKEFRNDARIQNFDIIERSERGMSAALKQATSPNVKSRIASDQALGVLFQKMLDPTSVVRESEFARTPQGAAMINRIEGAAVQLVKGGLALKNEDRQALADMAKILLKEAKITANKAFSEFDVRASELGLNKKIVFGGAKPFDIGVKQPVQPEAQIPQAVFDKIPPDARIIRNNFTDEIQFSLDGGQTWQTVK